MVRRASWPSGVVASAMWREMPQIVLLSYWGFQDAAKSRVRPRSGRTRAAASTGIEAVAPCRASSKGDPMKLSRTVGLAVGVSLPRFLPPPTRWTAP
jgi:hypothetical protein